MKTEVATLAAEPVDEELLQKIDAYWRAANYLSVGQIYLYDNPLLKRPLALTDVKHMLLGHWGTTPGQNFIYAHLNRVIKKYDLDMIYVSGPGQGGPAVVGNTCLDLSQHQVRMRPGFRSSSCNFRFPEESQATHRLNVRAPFMRAANSAIHSAIHLERCSIIPISWLPALSVMARRRPGRWLCWPAARNSSPANCPQAWSVRSGRTFWKSSSLQLRNRLKMSACATRRSI
jgi:hypothetical protein